MKVLVTGASGFVGAALAERLLQPGALGGELRQLVLVDQRFDRVCTDSRVSQRSGDIADSEFIRSITGDAPDVVFHLASLPGGAAEKDFALGYAVNVQATEELLSRLSNTEKPPVVVFASTIAVYGTEWPALVDDGTPLKPVLSYATQKLMGELLINDMSRRRMIDGRAVRLPGIVARPQQPNGLISAFMSDVFHQLRDGCPFTSPVSQQATAWWMSVGCCVDNLLHAAALPRAGLGADRVWQLPVLHLTMQAVVDELVARFGADRQDLIRWAPVEAVEKVFGRYPPLDARTALARGFRHDGDTASLVRRALQEAVEAEPNGGVPNP